MKLTPKQLDSQSQVSLDKWIDISSEEFKASDDYKLTLKWLRMLTKSGDLQTDSNGRVWGGGKNGKHWYPYHIESFGKLLGIRVAQQASN